ncbi:MAG: SDR family oxidoreductase [Mesorhizobium sp.]|uniref:SDR family NAD(P)-dependent oxidoreductase n=1 Tax=Mesorhizobium sp. TaxID=1871066 RepID=UPI001221B04D|nr:SDR family oxidoreductase [Mesorhizobium sp.]TIM31693.1 MAG: SDR family oxidoreductase [Mesorhizobium sp.]
MQRLSGRSALVIGAGIGIGRAVALAFGREGARVAIADCGEAQHREEAVAAVVAAGAEAFSLQCDVTVEADVAAAVRQTIDRHGRIDILVNNAGIGQPPGDFLTLDWTDWQRLIDVNLRGVAFGMRQALPPMLKQGYGRIINTASQLAHKPAAGAAVYSATKAAVVGLSVAVAQEVAAHGVTVNCVCPGPTDTATWRASDADWRRWKTEQLPIRRVAEPDEIAPAYVYLASDEASFMIGQSLSPNGGDVSW